MTTLVWDKPGERRYQSGVSRGVLYPQSGPGVAWNGLTGVEESNDTELKAFHHEGTRYLQTLSPGEFSAKLKAFTYPEEFEEICGEAKPSPGFSLHNQVSQSFHLSYRVHLGDDLAGPERGYKIHILYNLLADPETNSYATFTDSGVTPLEFAWTLTGTPPKLLGYRPTVHVSIDSTKTPPEILETLEKILYGTESSDPSLPLINDLVEIFGYQGALIILDHGDGSWTAIDESDIYITMDTSTSFTIHDADATFIDPTKYTISSTNVGGEG